MMGMERKKVSDHPLLSRSKEKKNWIHSSLELSFSIMYTDTIHVYICMCTWGKRENFFGMVELGGVFVFNFWALVCGSLEI